MQDLIVPAMDPDLWAGCVLVPEVLSDSGQL